MRWRIWDLEAGGWVKGGRSPAKRTLDAVARFLTLTAREPGRACVAWHPSPSGGEDSLFLAAGPYTVFVGEDRVASSALLLLCPRCSAMVLVCRVCDRGQRYCGRACSSAPGKQAQREAAHRYQSGPAGRAVHAARSRRWRERQRGPANVSVHPSAFFPEAPWLRTMP